VKRCLHRLGFTFRRARRVPPKAPPEPEQTRVRRTLSRLHRLEAAGRGQVWYGDESGFCLSPVVPYLWQKKGQTVGLPAQAHSRRLNVLGLMSRKGSLHSFPTQEKFTAQHLIQSLETLLPARVPTAFPCRNPCRVSDATPCACAHHCGSGQCQRASGQGREGKAGRVEAEGLARVVFAVLLPAPEQD